MAAPFAAPGLSGNMRGCSIWMRESLKAAMRTLREPSTTVAKAPKDESTEILAHDQPNWTTACVFAGHKVDHQGLIYASQHSFCVLTPRPVVRGHGIVCPRKPVKRHSDAFEQALFDLTEEEVDDLFLSVQLVSWILTSYWGCTATTVTLQQGEAAHQKLPHLFVHVVPRKANDFPCNDYIYELLAKAVPDFGTVRRMRTEAENIRDCTPCEGTTGFSKRHAERVRIVPTTLQPEPAAHIGHHTARRADSGDINALSLDEIGQHSREIRAWLMNLEFEEAAASPCKDSSQANEDVGH